MRGTIVHKYESPHQQASPAVESKSHRIIRKKQARKLRNGAGSHSCLHARDARETWLQEKEHSKQGVQMKKRSSLVPEETEMFAWRFRIEMSPKN